MFELEKVFLTLLHVSLYDLDRTDIDTLYGWLGYMKRKSNKKKSEVLTIGKRKYKRVTADEIHF